MRYTWKQSTDLLPTAAGHAIEYSGTPMTQRVTLNFVGAGVVVTDAGGKTVVTIAGGGGGGGSIDDALALQALL